MSSPNTLRQVHVVGVDLADVVTRLASTMVTRPAIAELGLKFLAAGWNTQVPCGEVIHR